MADKIEEEYSFEKKGSTVGGASTFITKRTSLGSMDDYGRSNWVGRLCSQHPPSLLLFLTLNSVNDGLNGMRGVAVQNIYKERFQVEASDLQKYNLILTSPMLIRSIFGIIVDAKVIRERKWYIFSMNFVQAFCMLLIFAQGCSTPDQLALTLFLNSLCHNLVEAVAASLAVEQGRKDLQHGQEDMSSLRSTTMYIFYTLGALFGAYFIEIQRPEIGFGISFTLNLLMSFQALFFARELETNEQATAKDKETLKYEQQMREQNPYKYANNQVEVEKPSLPTIFAFKAKLLYQALAKVPMRNFFIFLTLQGLTMPGFYEFDYYYALDVLNIPLVTLNLLPLYFGWMSVLIPTIYQKFFAHRNFVTMFAIAQLIYVVAESINLLLASRYNLELGIPDLVLFIIGGQIASVFEGGFTAFPSIIIVSKMIPPGIESTMYSLSITMVVLNQYLLRSFMGVVINDNFLFVDNENMQNYVYIKVVAIFTSFIPLSYMWCLIPSLKETEDLQKEYAKQREEEVDLIRVQEIELHEE